jgi:hypothetical protein
MGAHAGYLADACGSHRSWSEPWLAWLDARCQDEVARLRARYSLSMNELIGLYTSDEQVDQLLSLRADMSNAPDAVQCPVSASLLDAAERGVERSPLGVIAQRFQLDLDELRALFVVLAPELELRYATVFGYLNDEVTRRHATVDLAERLASVQSSIFDRMSRLVDQGIVRVLHDGHSPWRGAAVVAASRYGPSSSTPGRTLGRALRRLGARTRVE